MSSRKGFVKSLSDERSGFSHALILAARSGQKKLC